MQEDSNNPQSEIESAAISHEVKLDTEVVVVPEVYPFAGGKSKAKAKTVETVSKAKYEALEAAAAKVLAQYRVNHKTLTYPGMAELAALLDS